MAKSDAQVKFVIGNTNIDGRSQTCCFLPAAQKEFQEHSKALSSNTLYHILSKIISETSISWSHLNPRQASFGNMGPAFCNFSLPQKVLRIRELPLWQIGIAMISLIYGSIGATFHKSEILLHRNRVKMHKFQRSQIIFEILPKFEIYSFLFFSYSPIWQLSTKFDTSQFFTKFKVYIVNPSVGLKQQDDEGVL